MDFESGFITPSDSIQTTVYCKYRLCKETGISFNSLTSLENGGDVRLSTLERIAKVLKVEVKDLFE